ncbi:MAG: Hypothetical protein AJITA_00568 [Acetilactobacillus jinshanensis]
MGTLRHLIQAILQSSARMKYVKNRLRTTVKAMIHTIYLQSTVLRVD